MGTPRARVAPGTRRPDPVDLGDVTPVQASRLPELVAQQIRDFIVAEGLAENTRLPAERDLAIKFGASRPTISQALRTLSLMGLVEIRPGSGAYVVHQPDKIITASVNLMLDLDKDSVSHLAKLRLWLETIGARESARQASPDDLARIHAAFERLSSSAGKTSAWIAADTVFHASIVRSSGNPFLAAIYESVHTAVIAYEHEPWIRSDKVPSWLMPRRVAEVQSLHESIMMALRERDEQGAVAAVLRHHQIMVAHLAAPRSRR
jgi:GntR family transcriptional regulator, transcriptional repressor for pyruvate dehydrogenase complex